MKSFSLGSYALSGGVAVALLAGCGGDVGSTAMPTANGADLASPRSRTFDYTGKRQFFKVPAGVTRVTVVVRGAAGGGYRNGSADGRGGRVFAVIPVTPGERLAVFVGGTGSGSTGGFNGGASGGMNRHGPYDGFGGGGASDIRENGDRLIDRVIVAGGGGGEGGEDNSSRGYGIGSGGTGGGSIGGDGAAGWFTGDEGGGGGAGGTQDSGGSGGSGGGGTGGGHPGEDGTLGRGGHGGAGCQGERHLCFYDVGGGGGGGGGGYYGGGGGGGGDGVPSASNGYGGGGGGGGSSYIEPSALRFHSWQGWKNATTNGLVVFSW
jgi:hypothetical protein